jgi:hypothetical protein
MGQFKRIETLTPLAQEPDNCFRNLIDERFHEEAVAWCPQFLAGTTTAPAAIPTNFGNCEGNVQAVSSACSCITYSNPVETEPATSTEPVTSTATEEEEEECTDDLSDSDGEDETTTPAETTAVETTTTEPELTTSTITLTTTRTITSCPAAVPSCPGGGVVTTTVETIVTTTVCPVTETPGDEEPTDVPSDGEDDEEPTGSFTGSFSPVEPTPIPTITTVPIITSTPEVPETPSETTTGASQPIVTAGAARVGLGVGAVAAVAGLLALF